MKCIFEAHNARKMPSQQGLNCLFEYFLTAFLPASAMLKQIIAIDFRHTDGVSISKLCDKLGKVAPKKGCQILKSI